MKSLLNNNFINKWFRKSSSIRVIFLGTNRRIKYYYVIPEGDEVTIKADSGIVGRYKYDPERVFIHKKFSTIYVIESNAAALNPYDFNAVYDSETYETSINNTLATDLIKATESKPSNMLMVLLVISVIMTIIFGILNYQAQEKIRELLEIFTETTSFGIINIIRRF